MNGYKIAILLLLLLLDALLARENWRAGESGVVYWGVFNIYRDRRPRLFTAARLWNFLLIAVIPIVAIYGAFTLS